MDTTSGAVKNLMRMLECLDFPSPSEATVDTLEGMQKIIIWLEDRKIRALDVSDRDPLRSVTVDWERKVSEVGIPCMRCKRCFLMICSIRAVLGKHRLQTPMDCQQSNQVSNVANKLCNVFGLRG